MGNHLFIELLQIAAGARDALSEVPAALDEWEFLFKNADKHGLLGVTSTAVEKLAERIDIPQEARLNWSLVAAQIRDHNARQQKASAKLYRTFLESGFRNCILKGQAAAAYYPEPSLRQSGDIDLWAEGSRQDVLSFLQKHFHVRSVVYHHCNPKIFKGIEVEVHFTPTWMNSPFANRRLQRWFSACADTQFSHFDERVGCCTPLPRFDGVYLLLHIYRHVLQEGIGLRQLLDYHYLLTHLGADDRHAIVCDLKSLGLYRFARAVMYVLQETFRTDDVILLCPPDARSGETLLQSILQSGNFGHADPVFNSPESRAEGILRHGWRKIKRNLRFLTLCPSEVFWMPWFVTWQYFWRLRHGYLYKNR